MTHTVCTKEVSERMSQQWGPLKISTQDWLQVEVDLAVLSKELRLLANFCTRIENSLPDLELSE